MTVNDNLSQAISEPLAEDAPLLFVINDDPKFTQLLHQTALTEGIQALFFCFPTEGKSWLQTRKSHQFPDIALIRLSFSENITPLEEYLSLIDEFNRLNLSIPVIVISDRDRFADRLLLAQRGVTFFVKQPITPEKAIDLCQKGWERSFQSRKVMIVDNDVDLLRQLPSALEPWGLVTNTLDDSRQFSSRGNNGFSQ